MDMKQAFQDYAQKRIADLEAGISLMERGVLKTGQQSTGGVREDTTAETLVSYRRQLQEITDLLSRMTIEWGK